MLVPLILTGLAAAVHGIKVPLTRRGSVSPSPVALNPSAANNFGFSNAPELYSGTIYLEGQPIQVQLDTGSSDLWVDTSGVTLSNVKSTGYNSITPYGDGSVAMGPILQGNVTFGEYTVEGQAFMSAPGSNATTTGQDLGLFGISLPGLSNIYSILENSTYNGLPFLANVFYSQPVEQAFVTMLLSRSAETGIVEGGLLTIAEVADEYESIMEQPKLPIFIDSQFITPMDGVYVNGKFFTGNRSKSEDSQLLPNVTLGDDQLLALLDSGTTLMAAPRSYVDAVYGNVSGGYFNASQSAYIIPCDTKLNVSMKFGSEVYPVDPLDLMQVNVDTNGTVQCVGSIQVAPADAQPPPDFILGDAFLRNVYILFYHGSSPHPGPAPYIQMLSTTDIDAAWSSFDALNLQRILQAEVAQIQINLNITSSTPLVASQSYSYSVESLTSADAHLTASPSKATASSHSATVSTTPALVKLVADAVEATASASATPTPNASGLMRNSWIIIGLLAGVLVMLLGLFVKLMAGGRQDARTANSAYTATTPLRYSEKPYARDEEEYSTPYDDPARRY